MATIRTITRMAYLSICVPPSGKQLYHNWKVIMTLSFEEMLGTDLLRRAASKVYWRYRAVPGFCLDIEDLRAAAALTLFGKWLKLEGRGNAYIYQAAVNAMIDEVRRSAWVSQRDLCNPNMRDLRCIPIDYCCWRVEAEKNIPAELEVLVQPSTAFVSALCSQILAKLPLRSQEVMRLSFLEDMDDPDIGKRMGIPRRTVCFIRQTALKFLRKECEGKNEDQKSAA